jgi:hypothetical protein
MVDTDSPTQNGIAQIFSKGRGKKKRESASNSIKSTSTGTESDGHHSALDTLKSKMHVGHSQEEEDGDSEHNGLKKLVPTTIGSKRRRRKQEEEEAQQIREEAARGRSIAERGTLENESRNPLLRNDSGHSGSSLITYESDGRET